MSRVTSGLAGLLFGLMPVAATAMLAPHQGFYRLSLAASNAPAAIAQVDGGLVIEFRRTCDGWISNQRLAFVAALEDGNQFSHDVRFSSWEHMDGSRLRYSVRSFEGEDLKEEYRGNAARDPAGVVASFSVPEEKKVPLPPETVFPTAHLERVLQAAAAGERFVSHDVFDGWGFDALTQVTTVIGQPRGIDPSAIGGPERRAWPVSMAYYEAGASDERATPEFSATFLLDEEGVLREVVLDYGDFSLEAELVELERVEQPDC